MPDELQKVEMHGAYVYDCPECGVENWQRCVTEFLDKNKPEHAETIEEMYGLEALNSDYTAFRFVTYPNVVKCKECGRIYKPIAPGQDDNDDEEFEEFDSDMEI